MIKDEIQLRPRYGEVDQMGYVYHANYVSYCHQARTEMLRNMGIQDSMLEENNIMLPVISFEIDYKNPAHYDELLTITVTIEEVPKVRFAFKFEIKNEEGILIAKAKSTVVFVDMENRKPKLVPDLVEKAISEKMKKEAVG